MLKCNSCSSLNEDNAVFCAECGNKLNHTKDRKNSNTSHLNSQGESGNEIELNIDLSFIKNLPNNQKYIMILSWAILISFFMPFLSTKESLFDIWGYAWVIFFLPIVFFAIQYFYSQIKPSAYNKWLWQVIITVLSSMILSIYLTSYMLIERISSFLSMTSSVLSSSSYNTLGYTIWFVISLIWFMWILLLSVIEILNLFKKIR